MELVALAGLVALPAAVAGWRWAERRHPNATPLGLRLPRPNPEYYATIAMLGAAALAAIAFYLFIR